MYYLFLIFPFKLPIGKPFMFNDTSSHFTMISISDSDLYNYYCENVILLIGNAAEHYDGKFISNKITVQNFLKEGII